MVDTVEKLRGLVLSAVELKELHPTWTEPSIEDYLNIFNNLITLAEIIDVEVHQKIEEIDTDFTDGSIPFAESGNLTENNANLFWKNVAKRLGIGTNTPDHKIHVYEDTNSIVRVKLENPNSDAATVVGALFEVRNDNNYWGGMGITNSGSTLSGGIYANTFHIYNQGYANSLYTVDGNKDHVFYTDITDSHNFTFSEVMRLVSAGHLKLVKDNSKMYWGAGDDASLYYDGTDFNIKTNEVAASDLNIECGLNKTLELQTAVWDDQQVNLGTVKKGASSPNDIDYQEGIALEFVDAQSNEIRFNIQIAHTYEIGSSIEFHVHTAIQDNTAGNVRWQLKVSYADIMGNFANTATFLATQIVPVNSQDDHLLISLSDNIGSFSGVSGVLLCNLTRLGSDALDTLVSDINVVALDSHIELNTIGSRQETVK